MCAAISYQVTSTIPICTLEPQFNVHSTVHFNTQVLAVAASASAVAASEHSVYDYDDTGMDGQPFG